MADQTDYEHAQKVKYLSFESEIPTAAAGQERVIRELMVCTDRNAAILDCACGDGAGLAVFLAMGFTNVTGVEFAQEKAERARQHGYPVVEVDFHDLIPTMALASFDVVYSCHSLEHAHDPGQVLKNFHALLRPGGQLLLVLPYPDNGPDDAHCGKRVLHTAAPDQDSSRLIEYVEMFGFDSVGLHFDAYREPEIWLRFERASQ